MTFNKIGLSIIIFFISLAQLNGQVKFYISPDIYVKGSVSSDDGFKQKKKTFDNSDYFDFETKNFCWRFPFNFGVSAGITIKNKHNIIFGVNTDGSSDHAIIRFETYNAQLNYYHPNRVIHYSKAGYTRYYLNYQYSILNKTNKSNLSILAGIGLTNRAGPNFGGEFVGGFGGQAILNEEGVILDEYSAGFTAKKRGAIFNLGLSSDLYFKEKYWFSLSAVFTLSKAHMGTTVNTIRIFHPNGSIDKTWKHTIYNKASGLYIGISRKFQLYPWIVKKKDKKKKKRNKS